MFGDLEPIADHPGYRDRAARLQLLDEQGMDGALLFPTLGVGMQEALRHDIPALHAAFDGVQPLARRRLGLRPMATAASTPRR